MNSARRLFVCLSAAVSVALSGCLFVPKTKVNEAQAENRVYADQNKAQQVEIDSLKTTVRGLEEKLVRAEEELAISQQQSQLDRTELAKFEKEHADLVDRYRVVARDATMPASLSKQLQDLARRHRALHYDRETGLAKLDTDVLFESGDAELKPAAQQMLAAFAQVLRQPDADGLKVMVVGHTDSQGVGGRPVRDRFGDNFAISTARAVAVADQLKKAGVHEERIGVAGMGASQPIASNTNPQERLKNRRVEIFLVPPETPVVGWTDSTPSVYRR